MDSISNSPFPERIQNLLRSNNAAENDSFIFSLYDSWEWLGFQNLKMAIKCLISRPDQWKKGIDYIVLRRSVYFMNRACFRRFCMAAGTLKSREIIEYQRKLRYVRELPCFVRKDSTDQ